MRTLPEEYCCAVVVVGQRYGGYVEKGTSAKGLKKQLNKRVFAEVCISAMV